MFKTLRYCARAVVRHLNGDINKFNSYKNKAMEIYSEDNFTLGDLIPEEIKIKLYEMVS